MEEVDNLIRILDEAQDAMASGNSLRLHELSDQTVHSASIYQHTDYIVIAIIIYTLSKLVERRTSIKLKLWEKFVRRINSHLYLAADSLKKNQPSNFLKNLESARKSLTSLSIDIKPYVQEVLRKASINKASKIYEHGISLGQTSKLLGLSEWELVDYIGEKSVPEVKYNQTLSAKSRAKMALEFFS